MVVQISPLELALDYNNPRFVVLARREQEDIRKYLVTYEDVCQLTMSINNYGSLLPGERIVVLHEGGRYVVVEGNRRACALQMLLSRELIPDGFSHRIPHTSENIRRNCITIEVDVLPNREAAIQLMSMRHIEGVKQWKPLAKKQFFASNFAAGQTVRDLARITSIKEGEIKEDIRDYKFFLATYNEYRRLQPDFERDIIGLKTDPFWRIFKSKFTFQNNRVTPTEILKIRYDNDYNTISDIPVELFEQIVHLVFEMTIVRERYNTRNVLSDIEGVIPLLQQITAPSGSNSGQAAAGTTDGGNPSPDGEGTDGNTSGGGSGQGSGSGNGSTSGGSEGTGQGESSPGGPSPGGPTPRTFFETITWRGKLDPANISHQGLLAALNELFHLSTVTSGRQMAYRTFPVATGMVLRTVYEQALKLRLTQVGLWGGYCSTLRNSSFPTLSSMEDFIAHGANKPLVLPDTHMVSAFDRVIAAAHREFLNSNIHYPGNIRVSSDTLEGIAVGGMYYLIQGIINLI